MRRGERGATAGATEGRSGPRPGPEGLARDRRTTMAPTTTRPDPEAHGTAAAALGRALKPGIVLLGSAGEARGADERALALLGCRDGAELAARWPEIQAYLAGLGLRLAPAAARPEAASEARAAGEAGAAGEPGTAGTSAAAGASAAAPAALAAREAELPASVTGGRHLAVSLVTFGRPGADADAGGGAGAGHGHGRAAASGAGDRGTRRAAVDGRRPGFLEPAADGGGALLLRDAELAAALEDDLRAASHMRSLAQITPAVAHDLRAPINAMVLNLEVLKETLVPGREAALPAAARDPRERQQRYVSVLREELARLHRSLELFLSHISPRGDRLEAIDLREPAQDLAALLRPPARKQQAQVEVLVPDAPVPVVAHRHQLRQALLHMGLATLAEVPRDGTLEVRLECLPPSPAHAARARLRIAAATPPGGGGSGAAPSSPSVPAAAPRFSTGGTEARLEVALDILAAFGGVSRPPAVAAGGPGLPGFEIDFPLSDSN